MSHSGTWNPNRPSSTHPGLERQLEILASPNEQTLETEKKLCIMLRKSICQECWRKSIEQKHYEPGNKLHPIELQCLNLKFIWALISYTIMSVLVLKYLSQIDV